MRMGQALVVRLTGRLSPGLYGYLRRGRVGAAARKLLDVVAPGGGDVVSRVTGGPLEGTFLRADPRKQKEMLLGTYEPGVQQALQEHAGPGDIVFDVGAHVGFFSLLASTVVGDRGKVVAFEPDPYMSERLLENVDRNRRTNIVWRNAAAGAKSEKNAFQPGEGAGTGHLSGSGPMMVDVVSLDEVARDTGPPALIKIDVEGAELDVIAGGSRLLREHRPVLIIEAHGAQNEARAAEILRKLRYEIGFIDDPSGRRHLLATASS